MNRVETLVQQAKSLTPSEKQLLINQLLNKTTDYKTLRDTHINNKGISCPHCKSNQINRFGKYRGTERFICKECKRTFNSYTGTSLHGIQHRSKWINYIELMIDGKSIRKCAEILGITLATSFNWRHKILSAIESNVEFEGILESDETYFNESQKGNKKLTRKARKRGGGDGQIPRGINNNKVAIVVSKDRNGNMDMVRSNLGRPTVSDFKSVFKNKLKKVDILCSDAHRTYRSFANVTKLEHKVINGSKKQFVRERIYHIQHVNSIHSTLKNWLNIHFKGVSTKYMKNYLNWYILLERLKEKSNKADAMFDSILSSNSTINSYNKIQDEYELFIL